jgi:hypothetical protein
MHERDQQRFAKLISDFVTGTGFATPLHLILIDARGSVAVSVYRHHDVVEQICAGPSRASKLKMIPPLVATVVGPDGCGKSAVIEVVRGQPPTLQ